MTYTPKEWKTGDIITATDLNNIEDGVESAISKIVIVSATTGTYDGGISLTLNKTVKEIADIIDTSFVVIKFKLGDIYEQCYVSNVENSSPAHIVTAFMNLESFNFEASSENDYPVALIPTE